MKYIIKLVILFILIISMSSVQIKEKEFHVQIEQDGKLIEQKDGVVELEKKEFSIVFEFAEPMGLLVNSSFNDNTYTLAAKGVCMSKLPGFENTGMAEGLLNPDKEIFISNDSPSFWFYDNNEANRFNSVEKIDGKLICKRIIQKFYDVESGIYFNVENVSTPLYIVCISYKQGKEITDQKEIKREWIQIRWK